MKRTFQVEQGLYAIFATVEVTEYYNYTTFAGSEHDEELTYAEWTGDEWVDINADQIPRATKVVLDYKYQMELQALGIEQEVG